MYTNIEDFVTDWQEEKVATAKVFAQVSDNAMATKVHDNVRSLGRLAWHITQTVTEMPFRAGILTADHLEHQPIPSTMAELISTYEKYCDELANVLADTWKDVDLTEKIDVYGQPWERRKVLTALLRHQAHHRAQMTVVMRLLGLEVPGTYGPSREEWAKYGMEAQD